MKLSMIVNGFEDMRSDYVFKRAYAVDLSNDDYDVPTARCWNPRFPRQTARSLSVSAARL